MLVRADSNAVNGVPACANAELMRDRMRNDWGFKGMIISDAGAVDGIWGCDKAKLNITHDAQCHNFTKDTLDAAVMAIEAGCDLNYGTSYANYLGVSVSNGRVSMETVRESVKNVFRVRMLTQMEASLTDPATIPLPRARADYNRIPFSIVDSAKHRLLARNAAAASIVLLQNHNGTLPLPLTQLRPSIPQKRKIVVVGEHTSGLWSTH
eukprot:SAG31_NODE_12419_length_943_cov_1.436019_2_plen_208_part_01